MSKEMHLQNFSLKRKKFLTCQDLFVSLPQKKKIVIFFSTLWKLYFNLACKAFWEPALLKKIMTSSGKAECLSLCRTAILCFSLLGTRNTLISSENGFL